MKNLCGRLAVMLVLTPSAALAQTVEPPSTSQMVANFLMYLAAIGAVVFAAYLLMLMVQQMRSGDAAVSAAALVIKAKRKLFRWFSDFAKRARERADK
jgi:hypothetical protein